MPSPLHREKVRLREKAAALTLALGFLGQREDDAGGICVVACLADLEQFLAPGTPDLKSGGAEHKDFPASRTLDLGSIPSCFHCTPLEQTQLL